jgi:nucleotide-binding universal stress UspA family protein
MSVAPIVVGTDGSVTAHRAVEKAGALASALDAPLHIVMSCSDYASAAWQAVGGLAGDGRELSDAAQIVSREQEDVAAGLGIQARTHVCAGDPADALLGIAESEGAQMIVVGNRGMRGARRVLGSVPNSISHRANCAVLIVPTGD